MSCGRKGKNIQKFDILRNMPILLLSSIIFHMFTLFHIGVGRIRVFHHQGLHSASDDLVRRMKIVATEFPENDTIPNLVGILAQRVVRQLPVYPCLNHLGLLHKDDTGTNIDEDAVGKLNSSNLSQLHQFLR